MTRITRAALLATMTRLDACSEAVEWVTATKGTPAALWAACPRGDWMMWLAGRVAIDRRPLVLAACDCARTALVHVPSGEMRPLRAIETAEAWCRGRGLSEMRLHNVSDYATAGLAWQALGFDVVEQLRLRPLTG